MSSADIAFHELFWGAKNIHWKTIELRKAILYYAVVMNAVRYSLALSEPVLSGIEGVEGLNAEEK
jgi:hypothetical protein